MGIWGDIFSGDTLAGAGSGLVTGLAASGGNPYGALAGGVIGAGLGAYSHDAKEAATAKQANNLDQIIANMKAMTGQAYNQHIQDTQKALQYFGPAENYWSKLYGSGSGPAQTGQADWGNTGLAGGK